MWSQPSMPWFFGASSLPRPTCAGTCHSSQDTPQVRFPLPSLHPTLAHRPEASLLSLLPVTAYLPVCVCAIVRTSQITLLVRVFPPCSTRPKVGVNPRLAPRLRRWEVPKISSIAPGEFVYVGPPHCSHRMVTALSFSWGEAALVHVQSKRCVSCSRRWSTLSGNERVVMSELNTST